MKLDDDFPIVVGYNVAGVTEQVGADVGGFKVGDRVFANAMTHGLGPKLSGSVAEYATCEENLLATIPEAAQRAAGALMLAECRQDDKVFVSAGAGGVGIHLIQIAKNIFGASEVGTTASGAKMEFVKKYGADHVVDYRKENAGEVLKGWADVVVDCTKETDMEKHILKSGGRLVSIAEFSKPDITTFQLSPTAEIIEKVRSAFADGGHEAVIDAVYPFEEAKKAVEHVASGRAKGKIVIQVSN